MRAGEVSALLAQQAESLASTLLPNGKRAGREWECGSLDGEEGHSLKVCISGSKAGIWADFSTGESGDLLDLWMRVKGLTLSQTIEEAKGLLGIRDRKIENPKRHYSKPPREGVSKLHPQHEQWLREVRKIRPETAAAFKLASKGGELMFPYLVDGELIFAKYRKVPAKNFRCDADCEAVLFGWQIVPSNQRSIAIVEGELDALALYEYGIPALSVPFGGGDKGKQAWIDNEFDRLAIFDCLFLCLDSDTAGKQATEELIKRLGRERCRVVTLPEKDANECLMKGVPRETIVKCFATAKTQDPEQLRNAGEFADELVAEFTQAAQAEIGIRLPWRKVDDKLVLRPCELSIWAGYNGHGKSEVIGHVLADSIAQEWRACVASLEFKPAKWLKRLVRQATGLNSPTSAYVRHVANHFRDRLWVFDAVGTAKAAQILEVFAYAARRYGVRFFVIDNLAKCGFGDDDYNGQKKFVDQLTDFCKAYDAHVALICHMRKGEAEERPGGKMDIKGSGGITDMADTVLTVWRNKPKEKQVRELQGETPSQELLDKPDCIIQCTKQRNGEHEPGIALWFDLGSHQYLAKNTHKSRPIIGMKSVNALDA